MNGSLRSVIGFVIAFAIVGLGVPTLFVTAAIGEAYNPGTAIFGPYTHFYALLVIPLVLGLSAIARWKLMSRLADGAFAGSIVGCAFLAIFVLFEYLSSP